LQRKIEIERQQKEKIVHDIRALVKPSASVNSDSLAARKHSVSCYIQSKLTYTGGYTPTPIALLKSVEKAKIEAEQKKNSEENDNQKDVTNLKSKVKGGKMKDKSKSVKVKKVENVEASKQQSTKGKSQSVAKKKLNEQLSIEDLFETDVCLFIFALYLFSLLLLYPTRCLLVRNCSMSGYGNSFSMIFKQILKTLSLLVQLSTLLLVI
ncbi:unnamed protein product, partial [Brugia pahangi]|uniref:THOC2 n=1 Tax=Brugia pahangi TaxID=6280 RepID=A0A0N4THT1_BRUPA